jgi:hypothetical protein
MGASVAGLGAGLKKSNRDVDENPTGTKMPRVASIKAGGDLPGSGVSEGSVGIEATQVPPSDANMATAGLTTGDGDLGPGLKKSGNDTDANLKGATTLILAGMKSGGDSLGTGVSQGGAGIEAPKAPASGVSIADAGLAAGASGAGAAGLDANLKKSGKDVDVDLKGSKTPSMTGSKAGSDLPGSDGSAGGFIIEAPQVSSSGASTTGALRPPALAPT